MRILSILAALLLAAPLAAQDVAIYDSGGLLSAEQAAFDVTHYDIDLRVDPAGRSIAGAATTTARIVQATRQLVLDLDTLLTVASVTEPSSPGVRPLDWERRGGRLWIDLGEIRQAGSQVSVRVAYSGAPLVALNAPWDGGFVWAKTPSGAPWIATAVQGQGSDVWWPSKDHVSDKPDSLDLHIRVPSPLVVATNGRLEKVESHSDGTRTFHSRVSTPISAYNVALNIAPYVRVEASLESVAGGSFPVVFYALPEDEDRARAFMPEILEHLAFFEELLGPYPFRADGYAVAQTPHLGMEHQTIIAYGADFDRGAMTGGRDWGFDALHHHELAHEWWGNLVTNADWKDMWLHEGFATYMQSLYAERLGGPQLYRAHLANERRNLANRSPVAPRQSRTAGEIYFDAGGDIYGKGALVLHSLRWVVGDAAFFTALRRMAYPDPAMEAITDGRQTRSATTDDFLTIAERYSGQELDWFFEVYLRQPELPQLMAARSGETLRLRWVTPDGLPFPMPIEIEVNGTRTRLPMPEGRAEVEVPRDATVVVDPDSRVLRSAPKPTTIAPA